jgi:class 3 adenylate cyclase/tetratricopeptide (TPR) repeat protein
VASDFLSAFVPVHVRRVLGQQGGAPKTAWESETRGAAIVADIAGSTALTESLDVGGGGADALSMILDTLFGTLSDIVEDHGGEVIHLAGDGLLAVWPEYADQDLGTATIRAAACGLRIQSDLAGHPVLDLHRIRMRVGVSAGTLWLPVVGGFEGNWFSPVGGAPLRQIGAALEAARPGDVVVAPEAIEVVGTAIHGSKTPTGFVRVASVADVADRPRGRVSDPAPGVERLVPEIVAERAAAGMVGRFAELRTATSVFVKAAWTDDEPEDRLDRLQRLTKGFQETVARYDGTISSLLFDEKGLTMVGNWGGSGYAHEDDPVRALRAAMSFPATAEREVAGIGVATGRTFLGDVGSDAVRRFVILGRAINLAARLSTPAAGVPIRCDATTMIAARGHVAFEERSPLYLKGVPEPTKVFRPVAPLDAIRGESQPMVGRGRERATLLDLLADVVAGKGSTVFVEGEAGIGKSTLVRDLLDASSAHVIRRQVLHGSSLDQTTPYYPWRSAFTNLTRGLDIDQLLDETLDEDERARRPIIDEVLPGVLRQDDRIGASIADDHAETVRSVLARLFARLVEGAPLLLILEDAHWFDTGTWGLIEAVASRCPNAMIVCVTRGSGATPDPAELRLRRGALVVSLALLTSDETVALACNRLDVPAIPAELAELIRRRTEGHPLYTESLIRSFRDEGVIQIVGPTREVRIDHAALEKAAIPSSVLAIIAGRIDRLPLVHQSALKVASVVGRDFTVDQIVAIHPDSPSAAELEEYFAEAVEQGLLEKADDTLPGGFRFSHVLVVEATYGSLLAEPRRQIHRALAERLSAGGGGPDSILAHHWSEAGEPVQAVAAFDRAARSAFLSAGYRETIELVGRAEALAPPEEPALVRAGRSAMSGEAHVRLGELQAGHLLLLEAVRRAGMPMPPVPWRVRGGIGYQLLRQVAHRVFTALAAGEPERIEVGADAYWSMTATTFGLQDASGLVYVGLRATNEAERVSPTATLARGYSFLAYAAGIVGRRGISDRYHARALSTAAAAGSEAAVAEVMLNRAVLLTALGTWDPAEAELTDVAARYQDLGNRRDRARTLAVVAYGLKHRGDLDRSLALYRSLGGIESEDELIAMWAASGESTVLVRRGLLTEAIGVMTAHAQRSVEVGEFASRLTLLGTLALALWQEGRIDQAVETALTGLDTMEGMESFVAPHAFDGYAEVARVLLEAADHLNEPAVHQAAGRAVRSLGAVARRLPIARPRAEMTQAVLLASRGRRRRARRLFEQAIHRAEVVQMPYERALGRLMMGRSLGDVVALGQAATEFSGLGAVEDARLSTSFQVDT